MKEILVVYYTQSGQIKTILDSLLKSINENIEISVSYEELKPAKNYPFPWGSEFYDSFPESVNEIPCELEPYKFDMNKHYDLVILAYQPWYLSLSIPINSFLQDASVGTFLRNKNVLSIQGVRNMWYGSLDITKRILHENNAKHVGNIIRQDRTDNFIAGFTVVGWMIYGKKKLKILPESGVNSNDIKQCETYGRFIEEAVLNDNFESLQSQLVANGAVQVKYHLLKIDKTAKRIFKKFANFIVTKGEAGNPIRKKRVLVFKYYLLFVFIVLSPVVSLLYMLLRILFFPIANKTIKYYKSVEYRE